MIDVAYEKLSHNDREEFIRIANLLLSDTFLLRERLDNKEGIVKINRSFNFVERNMELFISYLRLSGWELQNDKNYGVISLYNRYGKNRLQLNKISTQILLTLRLIYDEEREKLSLRKEIVSSTGELLTKMLNMGIIDKKPSDRDITSTLAQFKRYSIVDKLEGMWSLPDTKIIIYPSILFIITNERVNTIYDMLQGDLGEDGELDNMDIEEEENL